MTSLVAKEVDTIFFFIVLVSVILTIGVMGTMIWFSVRYSRKKHPEARHVKENPWLEVTWTAIPTVLVLAMFWFGYEGFRMMRTVPVGAMDVQVYARMWDWRFEYPNGTKSDRLYVPLNKPVKLLLHSEDVVHGFYLPAFRIKEDVVPGKDNWLWFQPLIKGEFDIFCSMYCGERHSYMMTKAVVIDEADFNRWYESKGQAAVPGVLPDVKTPPAAGTIPPAKPATEAATAEATTQTTTQKGAAQ